MTEHPTSEAVIADCWQQGLGIAQTRIRVAQRCGGEQVGPDRVHREFVHLDAETRRQPAHPEQAARPSRRIPPTGEQSHA